LQDAEDILLGLAAVDETRAEAYSKLGVVYNFRGDGNKAINYFLKAIETDNTLVPAYYNLCLLYMKLRDYDKAISYGEQGLEYDPSYLDLYYTLAFSARLKGDLEASLSYMQKALTYDEHNIKTLANYAPLLFEKGLDSKAMDLVRRIIDANPQQVIVMAKEYMATKQYERAESILNEIISAESCLDEAYTKLGVIFTTRKHNNKAIELFHKALSINASYVPAFHNLCLAYTEATQFEKAIDFGCKGLFLDPSYLELYYAVALAFRGHGKLNEGLEYLQQALAHDGCNIRTLTNYAAFLFEKGDKENAKDTLEKVIAIHPENGPAHRMLSLIKKYDKGDAHVAQMKGLLAEKALSPQVQSQIHFALGKAYEGCKDFELSFVHYKQANALHRQDLQYSLENEKTFFEHIKTVFSKEYIDEHTLSENSGKTPIFILGMPRSSTSLVEQILASHPKVFGAGELRDLGTIQFQKYEIDLGNYIDIYANITQEMLKDMARNYMDKLEALAPDYPYVTDKMPMNFRFIGLIACLFPQAKIIHCIRDPRDICLSIFKTLFTGNLPYAYDEHEVAEYYKLYENLMIHWHKVLPERIYDLRYDDLIHDPQNSIRGLLEYCGLEWHDDCLNFHKTKRSVTTASAMQVKQPLYKSALAYWKNYEPYLSKDIKSLSSR